jgi:hypothetical protein
MTCPDEIADILLEILKVGILRIRSFAWNENPARCAIEADHLHNLPDLLTNFSQDLLKFYWDVSRASFIQDSLSEDIIEFNSLWDRLATHLHDTKVLV